MTLKIIYSIYRDYIQSRMSLLPLLQYMRGLVLILSYAIVQNTGMYFPCNFHGYFPLLKA